jgi:hypothetical protein
MESGRLARLRLSRRKRALFIDPTFYEDDLRFGDGLAISHASCRVRLDKEMRRRADYQRKQAVLRPWVPKIAVKQPTQRPQLDTWHFRSVIHYEHLLDPWESGCKTISKRS